MNILLDTNILIPLEDTSKILGPLLAEMVRLADKGGHALILHPEQYTDISHDKNHNRKEIVSSRLKKYQLIPSPPTLTDAERAKHGWKQSNENDRIDNLLLQAICRGAAQILVSNDNGIHRKAKQAKIHEKVHRLDQFVAFLQLSIGEDMPPPYGVQERYLHEFNVEQPFFDSLRCSYGGFDEWYLRVAGFERKAWCICNGDQFQAICIYKREEKPSITDSNTPLNGSALKLCTFKVGLEVRGRKLGERLLFSAFKYASNHNIPYVYLHAFGAEHELLISLCSEYGFEYVGQSKGRDNAYLKLMTTNQDEKIKDNLEYAIRYYPNYQDGDDVTKFLVPIRPAYHNDLFADTSDTAQGLFANDSCQYNPQSNTIKKAYLCHARIKNINHGDILLFYRTRDRKSVECVGIVEQVYRGKNFDDVSTLTSKRTVFSSQDIRGLLNKEVLLILFRYVGRCPPVRWSDLENSGIKGPYQSIRKITHAQYKQCFTRSIL